MRGIYAYDDDVPERVFVFCFTETCSKLSRSVSDLLLMKDIEMKGRAETREIDRRR